MIVVELREGDWKPPLSTTAYMSVMSNPGEDADVCDVVVVAAGEVDVVDTVVWAVVGEEALVDVDKDEDEAEEVTADPPEMTATAATATTRITMMTAKTPLPMADRPPG